MKRSFSHGVEQPPGYSRKLWFNPQLVCQEFAHFKTDNRSKHTMARGSGPQRLEWNQGRMPMVANLGGGENDPLGELRNDRA